MALEAFNLYPDFNVLRLSHVELGVTDLARSKAFYADTLGLQVTDEDGEHIYLRAMEERGHHCVILTKSAQPEVYALSFKVFSEADLDKGAAYFRDLDYPVEWVVRPYQGRTFRTRDNSGIPLEFYFKMDRLAPIHQKYALYHGVKPLRIDHFNCFSTDVDASVSFYNKLGFRTTEYTEDEASGRLWAAWMHRKGGVHDIAFTCGRGPRLHHTAFWVPTPLNIIDLLDLMATTGYVANIERGPGRHGISNAFFLYILDPDGHRIEIYCSDYQTVDPDNEPIRWDLKDPQRQTLWGAPAPRSWFEHGSVFAGSAVGEPALTASPIIAP
ncbi:catechol 2,3-dioxygenase [Gluconacetobacter sacchari DSM 12717]|uniref:3,4-dihydroxyphenylacetate 2,3-dioxygenase n=2 Tax=Gluconacetobacter sacchari TaxID=92759 RepID=A0A7W4ICW1_9PROT|nr:3,4-dihydroxyphenylacetate 2,3-dioxygenase [Gluconacetobacter sacchari]MBB2160472.1 3,4-dihydroxyphenylacetate 2,3-dioxygenase [Gluconacetobacter sacchari]GBQ27803.1 catechol 2,3-dioxygenase [Gluconacetobacter sacchari DSM 12717]